MGKLLNPNTLTLNSLSNLNQVLKELIQLSNQDFSSMDECLLAYIQFGIDATGFSTGMISRIQDDKYIILQIKSWNKGFQKGLVVSLCDTLCNTAYQSGKTLFCADTKNTNLYDLPARSYLNIEAIICTPLKVNDSIYGTLTFCSEVEVEDSSIWVFLTNLVELLGQSLSKIIKGNLLQERLDADRKLLEMGPNLLKMGSYKRFFKTEEIIYTNSFVNIFELHINSEKSLYSFGTFMSKVVEADKEIANQAFLEDKIGDVPPFEYKIIKKDGTYKWLRHEIKSDLKKGYVLGIVQDITALKNSLDELEVKNKELEQFAYVAAHDLREPLRTIEGFSKLLSSNYKSIIDEDGQEFLDYLVQASIRMKNQINGLLTYSKIGRSTDIQEINLDEIFKHILSDFEYELEESKAIITCDSLPLVKGYHVELRMLWQNFLSNALKFRKKNIPPRVNIKCKESDHFWHFSIEDNGIGIAERNIHKIFDLFTRLNAGSEYKGTGIGLAQCKKIIDLHGGAINVKSTLKEGTTIEFSLKK